jgi:hypothetical protein
MAGEIAAHTPDGLDRDVATRGDRRGPRYARANALLTGFLCRQATTAEAPTELKTEARCCAHLRGRAEARHRRPAA